MAHLDLHVTAMVAGGTAIARDPEGRVVFVEGALPGERVSARVVERKRDYLRAVALEVLDPSPARVSPPCAALAAGCGGCTWQHVAPGAQAGFKAEIVRDALRRIARSEAPVDVLGAAGQTLRTTARLGVDAGGRAGHHRRRSVEVVPATACLAAHPRLEELIVAGRYRGADEVVLRVGVASGERLAFVRPGGVRPEVPGDVMVVAGPGDAAVHEQVAGRRFRISAGSFFQPGPAAAEALLAAAGGAIADALPAGGHLVDLYAGVGLFASAIGSSRAAAVTAVEQSAVATQDARANLADLDATVVRSEVGRWRPATGVAVPDVVIADPARSGLGRPGVASVVATHAPRVVLVSCDPASFARDSSLLAGAGYELRAVTVVDAFPDTFHVEAVGRFDLR